MTLVLPAAGSNIPVQGAAILKLKELGLIPDVICASSSGAIISVLACCAGFQAPLEDFKSNFFKKADMIKSEYYAKKWYKYLPVFLAAAFKESFYDTGKQIPEELVDFDRDEQPLLFLGTSCLNTGKQTVWVSRDGEEGFSITDEDVLSYFFCDFKSMQGIEMTERVVRASCSIPCLVPSVYISGMKYFDGGLESSSPFTALSSFYKSKMIKFNVIYVYQYNIYDHQSFIDNPSFIFETVCDGLSELINGMNWETILYCVSKIDNCTFYAGKNSFDLATAIKISERAKSSFILMMPHVNVQSDIMSTKAGELSEKIRTCYDGDFLFMHWYEKGEET